MAKMNARQDNIERARGWAEEFFRSNPGSSLHQCLKAMSNARVHPRPDVVAEVHARLAAEKLKPMMTHPARHVEPQGPRLVEPAWDDPIEEEQPVPEVNENTDLTRISRELLAVMKKHGIEGVILTVTDASPKPRAEWEVTYRKRSQGAADL